MNDLIPISADEPGALRMLLDQNPMVGAAKEGRRRFWTTREIALLKATYPEGGVAACVPLLPGRSISAMSI